MTCDVCNQPVTDPTTVYYDGDSWSVCNEGCLGVLTDRLAKFAIQKKARWN